MPPGLSPLTEPPPTPLLLDGSYGSAVGGKSRSRLSLLPGLQKYPQETFGALLDYPADYLRRYDELCQMAPHTGVAGGDSHHNQGMRATLREDGKVLVEDGLREKVAELDPAENPLLLGLVAGKKPGDVLLDVDLDPYERSFRHVSTHLLLPE